MRSTSCMESMVDTFRIVLFGIHYLYCIWYWLFVLYLVLIMCILYGICYLCCTLYYLFCHMVVSFFSVFGIHLYFIRCSSFYCLRFVFSEVFVVRLFHCFRYFMLFIGFFCIKYCIVLLVVPTNTTHSGIHSSPQTVPTSLVGVQRFMWGAGSLADWVFCTLRSWKNLNSISPSPPLKLILSLFCRVLRWWGCFGGRGSGSSSGVVMLFLCGGNGGSSN